MKRWTREQKRRAQRIRANVTGVTVAAAIFATGMVVGRCVRAEAAPVENSVEIVAEPEEPTQTAVLLDNQQEAVTAEEPGPYYPLTDEERDLVVRVVMGEAGGEDYDGQRLVAQCILNACLLDGIRPAEAVETYQYTPARPEPSESVLEAVSAVFNRNDVVTDELVLWFYNPDMVQSSFHESQRYILTHGNHKFFAPLS